MRSTEKEKKLLQIENERWRLELLLKKLIADIGPIPIANTRIMPYRWRNIMIPKIKTDKTAQIS